MGLLDRIRLFVRVFVVRSSAEGFYHSPEWLAVVRPTRSASHPLRFATGHYAKPRRSVVQGVWLISHAPTLRFQSLPATHCRPPARRWKTTTLGSLARFLQSQLTVLRRRYSGGLALRCECTTSPDSRAGRRWRRLHRSKWGLKGSGRMLIDLGRFVGDSLHLSISNAS